MDNWLSARLTPSKSKEPRWVEFSAALERVWEEFFDPGMSRLERLRSSYTADDADLIPKIREMGDYFTFEMPHPESRPVSVAWRRLELEYKDMELILNSVFRRHFSNLPVTWFPIFAPIDQSITPYGSLFKVAEGPWPERKNIPPRNWFLTSRGRLGVDYGRLLQVGLFKQEFLDRALPLLRRTKPLHIVYDGVVWYIRFDIPFNVFLLSEDVWWERDCGFYELQFSVLGSRFDYTAADVRDLDIQSALCTWDRINLCDISFIPLDGRTWHLDFFLPEALAKDWLPADTLIAGWENIKSPFTLAAGIWNDCFSFAANSFTASGSQTRDELAKACFIPVKADTAAAIQSLFTVPYEVAGWRLDKGISNVPDGWLIDPIIPGDEASLIPILSFADKMTQFSASMQRLDAFSSRDKPAIYSINFDVQADALMEITEPVIAIDAGFDDIRRLDRYPRFDDFPADKLPLDMPIGGVYA